MFLDEAQASAREAWPTLDELSLDYIHRVLDREQGSRRRAAAVLGIDPRTLDRILNKVRKGRMPSMQTNTGAKRAARATASIDEPGDGCSRGRSLP